MSDIRKVAITLIVNGKQLFGTQCGGSEPYKSEYFNDTIAGEIKMSLNRPEEGITIKSLKIEQNPFQELLNAVDHQINSFNENDVQNILAWSEFKHFVESNSHGNI